MNYPGQRADIYNKAFNPTGRYQAKEYTFPFSDNTFDFIFLTSVFTHMLLEDVQHYVAEIIRLLKPHGRVFSTWFLVNDASKTLMQANKDVPQILQEYDNEGKCFVEYTKVPEEMVGYEEKYIETLFRENSLFIEFPIRYGRWCKRSSFTCYQDIIVAEKRDDVYAVRNQPQSHCGG